MEVGEPGETASPGSPPPAYASLESSSARLRSIVWLLTGLHRGSKHGATEERDKPRSEVFPQGAGEGNRPLVTSSGIALGRVVVSISCVYVSLRAGVM